MGKNARNFRLNDLKPGDVLEGPSNCYLMIFGWEDWAGHEDVLFGVDYLGRKHHFWNEMSLKGYSLAVVSSGRPNVGAFTGAVRRNQRPDWTVGDTEQCREDQRLSEQSALDRLSGTIGVGSSTLFGKSIDGIL